jgi:hypothetical protein
VTGFSAEWLSLREPADARARDESLTTLLAQLARSRSPIRLIDLACGTGSNLRYLATRLGGEQQWLLVDSDIALLERVSGATAHCNVQTRCLDLAMGLRSLELAAEVVVTASALLDLVSDAWLTQLVDCCRTARCVALFALSYDGRITFAPTDVDDEWIRQLVNRHQLGDKGFGPALGPAAWQRTCELYSAAGYQVRSARSDWTLSPHERLLQQSLLEGWAAAALDLASNDGERCRQWLARRLAHVANGASHIIVGHRDVLAFAAD